MLTLKCSQPSLYHSTTSLEVPTSDPGQKSCKRNRLQVPLQLSCLLARTVVRAAVKPPGFSHLLKDKLLTTLWKQDALLEGGQRELPMPAWAASGLQQRISIPKKKFHTVLIL